MSKLPKFGTDWVLLSKYLLKVEKLSPMVKLAFYYVLPSTTHSSLYPSYVLYWQNTSEIKDEFADQIHVSWTVPSQRLGKKVVGSKKKNYDFCRVWLDYPPTK